MHVDERQRKAAELISQMKPGDSLKQTLMQAGYSEATANNGWDGVSSRVMKLLGKKGLRFKALGEIDSGTQEKITRGRLVWNVINGSDKGAQSAKILGSDRRINMFAPEVQAGIVVIAAPPQALERKQELLDSCESEPK